MRLKKARILCKRNAPYREVGQGGASGNKHFGVLLGRLGRARVSYYSGRNFRSNTLRMKALHLRHLTQLMNTGRVFMVM